MTTGWPSVGARPAATMRPRMSVVPPGANGTMYLIGFAGQLWPSAPVQNTSNAAATAHAVLFMRGLLLRLGYRRSPDVQADQRARRDPDPEMALRGVPAQQVAACVVEQITGRRKPGQRTEQGGARCSVLVRRPSGRDVLREQRAEQDQGQHARGAVNFH